MRSAVAAMYIAIIRWQLNGTDSRPIHEVRVRDHMVAGKVCSTFGLFGGGSLERGSITTTAPYCASPADHMLHSVLAVMVPIPSCTGIATNDRESGLLQGCSPLVKCTNEVPFYETDVKYTLQMTGWSVWCVAFKSLTVMSHPKQDRPL